MSALEETLELLEWPRLCQHLSSFTSTHQGRRHCCRGSLPESLSESLTLQARTQEMASLDGLLDGGLSFQGVGDLDVILLRCSKGGVASGEELLAVADTLGAARRLRRQIDEPELRPVCTALLSDVATLPELEQRLKFAIEEGGRVADRASTALEGLRRQWQELRSRRRDKLQDVIRRWSAHLQDTVIAERNGRPVLAVKAGAGGQCPGMVHDSSASGSTVFVEPKSVVDLGNRLADLDGRIREEEQRVLAELSTAVAEQVDGLLALMAVLLHLDLALARGRYGQWLGAVPPRLEAASDAPFTLQNLRHPLLVWQERKEQGPAVVPVSIEVSPSLRVVAITGPNTGGKTVTLKSLGLAALMARAGLWLPCSGSPILPWCAQVLADIGDEQSLQQSLSTFSGHVRRIGRILAAIDSGPAPALVLLDEVGAGTDPSEGSALATALLRALADRARLTVATTHFGELKALKYSDSRFENASVAFDSETLSPTYHLLWGIPGRSNALAIATRLGLDEGVITQARSLLSPRGDGEANSVIRGLEEQRQRQQAAAEDAAALLARTELLHEELLARWETQKQHSAERQERGRQRLETSIRSGQKEVRQLIRRLRDDQADGETARKAGQRLRKLEDRYRLEQERRQHLGWRPEVGDRIRVLALGKAAEVLAVSDDGLQLKVRCGVMRSTVELSAVESLDGRKPEPPAPVVQIKARRGSGSAEVRTSRNTIDVRGMRVHEAEAAVDDVLRGANGPVWVIHGIGSGRLKRGLRDWLASLAYVERVVDAEQGDGGAGCSVIWVR
ncbi:DNA mismatch repair protein/ MutS family [Synechococcus sp. BIOS-E4-1]|uniref:endonuclease MutS2 n=1 Tax=Synechococcus sp. BIOS-E4-1 TaxID=1400864 RepID=UPI001648BCDC|nr:endonuclease MutS2 [Synechococcus sp. BIOS-E4-1]QNI56348.1 DNA mismatch repair protein/ MutS family [Synechococcus sp. BIOS-E4-1]